MIECAKKCRELNVAYPVDDCRYWINYEEDYNCTNIAIDKNGAMKLRQISERMGLTPARIQQIEKSVLLKLKKLM